MPLQQILRAIFERHSRHKVSPTQKELLCRVLDSHNVFRFKLDVALRIVTRIVKLIESHCFQQVTLFLDVRELREIPRFSGKEN